MRAAGYIFMMGLLLAGCAKKEPIKIADLNNKYAQSKPEDVFKITSAYQVKVDGQNSIYHLKGAIDFTKYQYAPRAIDLDITLDGNTNMQTSIHKDTDGRKWIEFEMEAQGTTLTSNYQLAIFMVLDIYGQEKYPRREFAVFQSRSTFPIINP